MKPSTTDAPRTVRITNRGRDQLITIKRRTGLEHWNVISRWALALSLRENTPPPKLDQSGDSNVEMSWDVFSGGQRELWHAVALQRYSEKPGTHENLGQFIRAHVHRGIQMMSAQGQNASIVEMALSIALLPKNGAEFLTK